MMPFDQMEAFGCEQLMFCQDSATKLSAIIAIHDTTLGPALGGLRILSYPSISSAIEDVVRLARGMTYKAALAGFALGGGKAVIIGDAMRIKNADLFRSFGRFVDRLKGLYITAEDVGTTEDDMKEIHQVTSYVTGLDGDNGIGNPAPFTAYGVLQGIKEALLYMDGNDSLKGKHVAVQGAGATSRYLCQYLVEEGASLTIADIVADRALCIADKYGAKVVDPAYIHKVSCDIFSPCALGGILNSLTIPELRCRMVAGTANNQLRHCEHGDMLKEYGILYLPDYAINAGGLIGVAEKRINNCPNDKIKEKIDRIRTTLKEILIRAQSYSMTPTAIAEQIVLDRLKKKKSNI